MLFRRFKISRSTAFRSPASLNWMGPVTPCRLTCWKTADNKCQRTTDKDRDEEKQIHVYWHKGYDSDKIPLYLVTHASGSSAVYITYHHKLNRRLTVGTYISWPESVQLYTTDFWKKKIRWQKRKTCIQEPLGHPPPCFLPGNLR